MGTTAQQFCLKWNNHQANMLSVFDRLLSTKSLVDVTISCEGRNVKAHKVVLSACSPFFENLFIENPCKHPIVILKDIRYADLKALVEFMYKGEVNVVQEQLPTLLKTAETLKIKGLAEVTGDSSGSSKSAEDKPHASVTPRPESPSTRRKRQRVRRKSTDSAAGHSDSEESVPKASRTEHDDSSMDGATSLDDGSQASLHQQQQASSASGGQSQQAQQQSKEPSNVQSTAVTVNSSSSSANQANNAASSAANANSSTANGPNSSSKDADFEPTRLLEASMTTDHGADNSTDLNNSTGPDNTLIPDGLDIKPIITLEEGGATPAGSIVPATAAPSLQTGTDAISSLFPQATGAAALPGTSFQASPQSHVFVEMQAIPGQIRSNEAITAPSDIEPGEVVEPLVPSQASVPTVAIGAFNGSVPANSRLINVAGNTIVASVENIYDEVDVSTRQVCVHWDEDKYFVDPPLFPNLQQQQQFHFQNDEDLHVQQEQPQFEGQQQPQQPQCQQQGLNSQNSQQRQPLQSQQLRIPEAQHQNQQQPIYNKESQCHKQQQHTEQHCDLPQQHQEEITSVSVDASPFGGQIKNTKPRMCHICGKPFRDSYNLSVHLKTHSNERPISCPHCPYRSKTKACLSKHIRCFKSSRSVEYAMRLEAVLRCEELQGITTFRGFSGDCCVNNAR